MIKSGVEVIYNSRAIKIKRIKHKTAVYLDTDRIIEVDLAFVCGGGVPNSSFMEGYFKDSLDEERRIMVNSCFEVSNLNSVYALGDVSNVAEEKTAEYAMRHARHVWRNLIREKKGKPRKEYRPISSPSLAISFGLKNGILLVSGWCLLRGSTAPSIKLQVEKKVLSDYGKDKEQMAVYRWEKTLKMNEIQRKEWQEAIQDALSKKAQKKALKNTSSPTQL